LSARRSTLKHFVAAVALLIVLGGAAIYILTEPQRLSAADLPQHVADPERGKMLYIVGGCISCHAPPADAGSMDPSLPSGGSPLTTPLGTLYPPNITPDPATGIGTWSRLDFVNAVYNGLSPAGDHYIPAFPYASYRRMPLTDVLDLQAYAMSLPPVVSSTGVDDMPWAPLIRRGAGLWKRLAMPDSAFAPDPSRSSSWNLGAYLVNAPGHCGECHTPRNFLMIPDRSRHLSGGPHPEGEGKVPSLRNLVGRGRYSDADELAQALRFGEMMGFDRLSRGGMGEVQANLAKLPEDHVRAIAEYLVSLE
jgi:mono/diheme cytochrome c family protein